MVLGLNRNYEKKKHEQDLDVKKKMKVLDLHSAVFFRMLFISIFAPLFTSFCTGIRQEVRLPPKLFQTQVISLLLCVRAPVQPLNSMHCNYPFC